MTATNKYPCTNVRGMVEQRSRIFSNGELDEMERRKAGDKSDKYGIFSSRLKPRIKELLEEWFPKKKELQDLLGKP
jgi:hypothetical protein